MKKILTLALILISFNRLVAQTTKDSIEVKKAFGTVFKQNGKVLKPVELLDITRSNPEAYKEMQKAKSNFGIANILSLAGGALVGYPVGTALGGGEPNWSVAGVGAGLIVIGIPFSSAYAKHAKNGARIYNGTLNKTGLNKVDFKVGVTGSGVGLNVTF